MEILKKDKGIKSHTGKYNGHRYHYVDLLSIKEKPAEVKVTLTGKEGSVDVHCIMEFGPEKEWRLCNQ